MPHQQYHGAQDSIYTPYILHTKYSIIWPYSKGVTFSKLVQGQMPQLGPFHKDGLFYLFVHKVTKQNGDDSL